MSQPEVLQATENGVAWITLNRPDSLNALNAALLKALRAALEQAAADDAVRAVVITGAGRGFSRAPTCRPPAAAARATQAARCASSTTR